MGYFANMLYSTLIPKSRGAGKDFTYFSSNIHKFGGYDKYIKVY